MIVTLIVYLPIKPVEDLFTHKVAIDMKTCCAFHDMQPFHCQFNWLKQTSSVRESVATLEQAWIIGWHCKSDGYSITPIF